MKQRWVLAAVILVATASAAQAGPLRLAVRADANGGSGADTLANHPELNGEKVVSGRAKADDSAAGADVKAGSLAPCPLTIVCGEHVNPPSAFARAEVDGTTGALKVRAVADDGMFASASAGFSDVINFLNGPPTIDLELAIEQFVGDDIGFSFDLWQDDPFGEDILWYFGFRADEDGYQVWDNGVQVAGGNNVPGLFKYSVTNPWFAFFGFNADLSAVSGDGRVIADNSVYLKLDGVSANGFTYASRTPGGDPTPVPEPATAWLAASGAALCWARRRASRARGGTA